VLLIIAGMPIRRTKTNTGIVFRKVAPELSLCYFTSRSCICETLLCDRRRRTFGMWTAW